MYLESTKVLIYFKDHFLNENNLLKMKTLIMISRISILQQIQLFTTYHNYINEKLDKFFMILKFLFTNLKVLF